MGLSVFFSKQVLGIVTPEFQPRPSSGRSCRSRHDRRIATPDGSWCRAATLRYFSSARQPPATAGGSLPPDREKSSSAVRCVRGRERLEIEVDIFRAPDRTL